MLFSSLTFLLYFLPITFILYFIPVFRRNKHYSIAWKNLVLLFMSLIFYAWGEPVYVFLMIISILFNYNLGRDIERNADKRTTKKALLLFGIIFNLLLIGFFKYEGFIIDNINELFNIKIVYRQLSLPIGISFYTFQALSYVIDVYRGNSKTQKKLIPFALYITMFPQLIAGPIVQYNTIEKQLKERFVDINTFGEGIKLFIRGLAKKVIFANLAGTIYDGIMLENVSDLSLMTSWIGIFAYTMQIYNDFSGYSDMAIGLGRMFGFEFPINFDHPYKSKSITEFWRRWHISLSSWFRDYVYIPLGGNRCCIGRHMLNILIVWMLTGLWHGAAWNFVIWGLYYGILLIIEKYILKKVLSALPGAVTSVITFVLVMIGWVFFSSSSMGDAFEYLSVMFGSSGVIFDTQAVFLLTENLIFFITMLLFAIDVFNIENVSFRNKKINNTFYTIKALTYVTLFIITVAFLVSESYNPFLYFRF